VDRIRCLGDDGDEVRVDVLVQDTPVGEDPSLGMNSLQRTLRNNGDELLLAQRYLPNSGCDKLLK